MALTEHAVGSGVWLLIEYFNYTNRRFYDLIMETTQGHVQSVKDKALYAENSSVFFSCAFATDSSAVSTPSRRKAELRQH